MMQRLRLKASLNDGFSAALSPRALCKRSTAPPIQPKEFSLPEDREAAATNRFGCSGR
jgi:hypothetical protein